MSFHHAYSLDEIAAAFGEPEQATERKTFEVPETVTKGDRHDVLYRFLRSQKARNVSLDVALVGCHALNEQQCEPPIEKRELDAYLRRVWEQADTSEFSGDTFTREKGKFVPRHQGNLTTMFEQLGVEFSYDTFSQKVIVSFTTSLDRTRTNNVTASGSPSTNATTCRSPVSTST